MTRDVLGDGFEALPLRLSALPARKGPGVEDVATLVRYRTQRPTRGAMLYLHGYNDYFFQRHVAEHFSASGYDFYALDLRGYGRSLRDGQIPNYVADLRYHFEELDLAARILREDHGHGRLTVIGHSTGGLIATMWAHERRDDAVLDALVLNSPWLELARGWFMRTVGTATIRALGLARAPAVVVRYGLENVYGMSVHRGHHGEWDYDLRWKPISGFPIRAGWIGSVRRHHARLHAGLAVAVPVLVLHSTKSLLNSKLWSADAMSADTVLDVRQIARWAPRIGPQVSVVGVEGGMHDLFLSAEPVRARVLAEIDKWLADVPS